MHFLKYPAIFITVVLLLAFLLDLSPVRNLYRDRLLRNLTTQAQNLLRRAEDYERKGNGLVSVKLKLISGLAVNSISPEVQKQLKIPDELLSQEMFNVSTSAYGIDFQKADFLCAEELEEAGDPLFSVVLLRLEELSQRRYLSEIESGSACTAIRALGGLKNDRVKSSLAKIVAKGSSNPLTWEAMITSWRLGINVPAASYRNQVAHFSGWGRQYPVFVLGELRDGESVGIVMKALSDSSPAVRRHCVAALGKIGDPAALQALKEHMVADRDTIVRDISKQAIAMINRSLPRLENTTSDNL